MKNGLGDLNNILFAQLERLTDEELSPEAIAQEMERTQSVVQIADRIVSNARLQLDTAKLVVANGGDVKKMFPAALGLPAGVPVKETP